VLSFKLYTVIKIQKFYKFNEHNLTLFGQCILQCNALRMAFLYQNLFVMKVIILIEIADLIFNDAKTNMFTIMMYFILQESLLLFNDKKERKPYSR